MGDESPAQWKRWLAYVLAPALTIYGAINGIFARKFGLGHYTLRGQSAVAACAIFSAVLTHVHYFWEQSDRAPFLRFVIIVVSLICLLASAIYFGYLEFRP